jgi:F-type H+-transporting ATPase subunit c
MHDAPPGLQEERSRREGPEIMRKLLSYAGLLLILTALVAPTAALAQEADVDPAGAAPGLTLDLAGMGAALAAGLIAIGAGVGIGRFAAAAAEAIARQPSAASSITGAVNLPLFLLEGVAIIGLVVCLLIVFMRQV